MRKILILFLVVSCLLLAVGSMANAATYYVDGADGSNVTGDGSDGNEWQTITWALRDGGPVGSGDLVIVYTGTIHNDGMTGSSEAFPIDVPAGVHLSAEVTVGEVATIDAENNLASAVELNSGAVVEGFTINSTNDGRHIVRFLAQATAQNNTITGGVRTTGIGLVAGDNSLIQDNTITITNIEGVTTGITIANQLDGITIDGNTITAHHGVDTGGYGGGWTITNNTLVASNSHNGNGIEQSFWGTDVMPTISSNEVRGFATGIDVVDNYKNDSSVVIDHCTFIDNTVGIDIGAESADIINCIIAYDPDGGTAAGTGVDNNAETVNVSYSNVYGNATDYEGTISNGVGTISANANFTDSSNDDYTLLFTSPCIDAGTPEGEDMGAHNFGAAAENTDILLDAPDGGESWTEGASQSITWTSTNGSDAIDHIELYYSTNSGSTFPNTISADEADDGTYSWTIPDDASTTVRVRVIAVDTAGGRATDESSADFTIVNAAPSVTSIDPSSGSNIEQLTGVSIAGEYFESGATVKLTKEGESDINGTNVTFVDDTEITCDFDLRQELVGTWNVTVTNSDSKVDALANGFTISIAAPTVTVATPETDTDAGGVGVIISGNNFQKPYYERAIALNNSGGALTDYQVLVTADSSSIISAGKMQADGDDIRFLDSNGNNLSYWLEPGTINTTLTNMWVKVSSIPGGESTIYLTYGDTDASAASSGGNTFEFFDDFESYNEASLGGQGSWTNYNGDPQVGTIDSMKMALIYNFRKAAITEVDFGSASGSGRSIVARAKCVEAGEQLCFGMGSGAGLPAGNEWDVGYNVLYFGWGNTKGALARGTGGGAVYITNPAMAAAVTGTYYRFDSRWYGTTLKGFVDGTEVLTGTDSDISTEDNLWLGCHDKNWAVDWVVVRKFESNDPTVSLAAETYEDFAVTFGGTAATNVSYESISTITATAPAHAAGVVDIEVTNPNGEIGTLEAGFEYTETAPPTLEITAPNGGEFWSGGDSHNVTFTTTDESGLQANTLRVSYSTDEGNSYTIIESSQPVTSPYSWSVPSTNTDEARVKIEMQDAHNTWGTDESDANFTIDSTDPTDPSAIYPTTGTSTSDATPQFSWNASVDSLSGVASYEVRIDGVVVSTQDSTATYTPGTDLTDASHTWDARGKDNADLWSGWSAVQTFTVDASAPTAPTPTYPTTGIATNDATPTFTWGASVDSVSGISSYEVRIDGLVVSTQGATTTYTPGTDLTDASHTWDARAKNGVGLWGTWGATQTFTVDTDGPAAGAISLSDSIRGDTSYTSTIEVTVEASSIVGSPSQMRMAENAAFSTNDTGWVGYSLTYLYTLEATEGTHEVFYFLRDATLNESATVSATIIVDTQSPEVTSIAIKDTDTGSVVLSNSLTISIEASGVSADAVSMRVAENTGFTTNDTGWVAYAQSYEYAFTGSDGVKTAFYKVRDNASNESEVASATIEVDTAVPDAPVLSTPTNNSSTNDATPEFVWQAATGGANYEVRLAGTIVATTSSLSYAHATTLSDATYTWEVRARDSALNYGAYSTTWTFVLDTSQIDPTNISINVPEENVPIDEDIEVTFPATMDTDSAEDAFNLDDGAGGASAKAAVAGTFTWSADNKTMTFSPTADLSAGTTYTLSIGTGAKDQYGNALSSAYSTTFATATGDDEVPTIEIKIRDRAIKNDDYIPAIPTFQIEAEDNLSILASGVTMRLDGTAVTLTTVSTTSTTVELSYTAAAALADEGTMTHILTVEATDAAGNVATSEISGLKVSDGTAKITGGVLTHPTQYAPLGGGVLKIGYQLSTDAQVNIYLISKYGVIHWTYRAAAAAEGGKAGYNEVEFSGTSNISRSAIPNGIYMIKVISQNKVIGSGHVMVLD